MTLVLRNAEVAGRVTDVEIRGGRIAALGAGLPRAAQEIDAAGGALIPGLHDHHIHLLATAARLESVALDGIATAAGVAQALANAARTTSPGTWIRATGYDETSHGLPTREALDALVPDHPLRMQDRTGALWLLNSRAVMELGQGPWPQCVETDASGQASGRIWRGDAWLRSVLHTPSPSLAHLGVQLAAYGVTGVTDTGASNGAEVAASLAAARASGELPQKLTLMSAAAIDPSPHYAIGPVKLLFDERDLPDFGTACARVAAARPRAVAIHCVTATELAFALALFDAAGAIVGDRIEHGNVIPAAALGQIGGLGLTLVINPGFIRDRGDRYRGAVNAIDLPDLCRAASLARAGIAIAAGSDSPYAGADPWAALAAAVSRRTRAGVVLGADEALAPEAALALWLGDAQAPGGPPRRIALGAVADLCLLKHPLQQVLAAPAADLVAATLIDGRVVYRAA